MFNRSSALSPDLARHALDALDDGLLVFDRRDHLCFANRAFADLWELDTGELLGEPLARVVESLGERTMDAAALDALAGLAHDPSSGSTLEIELPPDRVFELVAHSLGGGTGPVGRLWRFRDRTAERRSELAALEARQLESLGVLAGGIAHDFNNLLSSILGHTELGLEDVEVESEAADSLRAIARVAERASQLTQQMLAYAGKGTVLVEPIDLSQVIRDVLDLVSVSIARGVEIELQLAEDLPRIIADAVQIRQVAMNLVLNAAEALPAGGTIAISTGRHHLEAMPLTADTASSEIGPGEFVYLEVVDSGQGMDATTMERIFDPFFSTKFTGRGLGLAAVQGIVRGHRGMVEVTSEPGEGTTFRVHLPCGYAADSDAP